MKETSQTLNHEKGPCMKATGHNPIFPFRQSDTSSHLVSECFVFAKCMCIIYNSSPSLEGIKSFVCRFRPRTPSGLQVASPSRLADARRAQQPGHANRFSCTVDRWLQVTAERGDGTSFFWGVFFWSNFWVFWDWLAWSPFFWEALEKRLFWREVRCFVIRGFTPRQD